MRLPSLVLAWVVMVGCAARTPGDQARALDERLVAPCCWRQTVADHDSPLATQIRAEIRTRLAAGEAPAAIEQRFVDEYGPQVLALGRAGEDPRGAMGMAMAIVAIVGLGVVVWLGRRWVRRAARVAGAGGAGVVAPTPLDAEAAERLDDELAATE